MKTYKMNKMKTYKMISKIELVYDVEANSWNDAIAASREFKDELADKAGRIKHPQVKFESLDTVSTDYKIK